MKTQKRHLIILVLSLLLMDGGALFAHNDGHDHEGEKAPTVIYFDISKASVTFTNSSYSGKDSGGNTVSGTHNASNIYEISGTSTSTSSSDGNVIKIGTPSAAVTSNFIIYLNGVNIDAPHQNNTNHAPAIYVNNSSGTVYLILKNGSTNVLKGYGRTGSTYKYAHAAIEKEMDGSGNLVITCEKGYAAYTSSNITGHTCTDSDNCGSLTATAYGAGKRDSGDNYTHFYSGAAIGSAGMKTSGSLNGLVIAGGKITANAEFNDLEGSSSNPTSEEHSNSAPGIGVGSVEVFNSYNPAGTIKITGGKIDSQAGSGAAACIGGGFKSGDITVRIYGGNITATRRQFTGNTYRGAGIGPGGGGTGTAGTGKGFIYIYDGTITASSQYGAAIGGSGGGESGLAATVEISGGTINASITDDGNAAAIGTCGSATSHSTPNATVTISGGTINTSGGGIGAGDSSQGNGGAATVTISGGTVNTSYIGGGNSISDGTIPVNPEDPSAGYIPATTGNGGNATIQISGGTVHVDGGKVGGGSSAGSGNGGNLFIKVSSSGKLYCHHISAGDIGLDAESLTPAQPANTPGEIVNGSNSGFVKSGSGSVITGHIRGGKNPSDTKFGKVTANISGGTVQGQFVLKKSESTSSDHCSFTMTGGTIDNANQQNTSGTSYPRYTDYGGGAIFSEDPYSTINISGGTIKNCNVSGGRGGAIHFNTKYNAFKMSGGTMENNSAGYGGAVFMTYAQSTDNEISGSSRLINNSCSSEGGALCVSTNSKLSITGGTISGNYGGTLGGAIYMNCNSVSISGSTSITGNSAGTRGGGIDYFNSGALNMSGTSLTIKDNTVHGAPNNVYLKTGYTITVPTSFAPQYLGIYNQQTSTPIPILSNSSSALTTINTGINNGTIKIYDDKQLHNQSTLTNSDKTVNFTGSPWSYSQRQIATTDYVYEISNVKQLTAFLCHVNGITPNSASFGTGDPTANGKLVADIDMKDQYWVPIANYKGTFDGNGYTIKNLTMVSTNASSGRGLFGVNTSGTITNVILKDCYFGSSTSDTNLGGIVSDNRGTVSNSVVDGTFFASAGSCVIGGVAGANSGTIHSCYTSPDMTGYQMGGLAGSNSGNIFNSFTNAKFTYKGEHDMGGLVGVNTGTIENCYVRLQGSAPASNFGWLVGSNSGSGVKYCYIPSGKTPYKASGTDPSGHGTYSATSLPVLYNLADNQVSIASGTNTHVPSGSNKQLLTTLNNWVTQDNTHKTTYTKWLRPWQKDNSSKFINDDLPLLCMPSTNAVAATKDDACLDYNQVNDLLLGYTDATQAVFLYDNVTGVNSNSSSSAELYIDEDVAMIPASTSTVINAHTGQTLKSYVGSYGERWHFVSSSLQQSKIGFTYHNTEPVPFGYGNDNPCGVTISENDDESLFPSDLLDHTTMAGIDLFCFYEPEYHWLNLKRNTDSHWHMNETTVPIVYNGNGTGTNGNETYLVPGKGYLVSINVDQLLQNKGTLNNGKVTLQDVTKTDANEWAGLLGYNLLGNPYQSYLDFEKFITDGTVSNTALWSGSDEYYRTFGIYDPKEDAYVQYKSGSSKGSKAASQYINMHQGFFIRRTGTANTAKFTNDMRTISSTPHFRGEQPAYPLVNLWVTDDEGKNDIAVLEIGRDSDEGSEKLRLNDGKGWLYLHHDDEDYAILFRTEVENYQPLWFEARETGTFTLSWETANAEFESLTLVDNIAGVTTDMLSHDNYVFEATPDQYKSRFKIMVGDWKDLEEHNDGASTGLETFAYYANGEIHLVETQDFATLQIVDMLGQVIVNTDVARNVSTSGMAPGVYILRLTDKNGTRTQKIILD